MGDHAGILGAVVFLFGEATAACYVDGAARLLRELDWTCPKGAPGSCTETERKEKCKSTTSVFLRRPWSTAPVASVRQTSQETVHSHSMHEVARWQRGRRRGLNFRTGGSAHVLHGCLVPLVAVIVFDPLTFVLDRKKGEDFTQ